MDFDNLVFGFLMFIILIIFIAFIFSLINQINFNEAMDSLCLEEGYSNAEGNGGLVICYNVVENKKVSENFYIETGFWGNRIE